MIRRALRAVADAVLPRVRDAYPVEPDRVGDRRPGTWVQTASGRHVWPLDPRVEDVCLEDIARGIANECRYGRQLRRRGLWYSVAEHSVIVSLMVERMYPEHPEWVREAALHDAAEAYGFGDVPRPLKYAPGVRDVVEHVEDGWQRAIYDTFDIVSTPESRAAIGEIDTRIICDEVAVVLRNPEAVYARHPPERRLGVNIACLGPAAAEWVFLTRFAEVFPEHAGEVERLHYDSTEPPWMAGSLG